MYLGSVITIFLTGPGCYSLDAMPGIIPGMAAGGGGVDDTSWPVTIWATVIFWIGLAYHVPAIPNKLAEWLRLDAESGTMPAPFPKGTGWVGLLHKIEARTPVENIS
jgi:hypothetical protein